MNPLLTGLGVPQELQALFETSDCVFDFGDAYEHYGTGFHRVPTSQNIWRNAPASVTEVVITHSAMEAIAYLTLNRHLHTSLENIAFVALGNFPHGLQTTWIRENFRKRKITFVFGNSLLGALADIKVAVCLRLLPFSARLCGPEILIQCDGRNRMFEQNALSLHVFEKAFGLRFGFKTSKPKMHLTYLDQLRAYGKQNN